MRSILISWFVLLTLSLVFAKEDERESTQQRKQSDLVKRAKPSSCRGLRGLPGRDGKNGKDGRDGRDALLRGERGKPGLPGPQGPQGPPGKLPGVVYTRWGRKHCLSKTTEMYSGVMGGTFYTDNGGASNYLCLPLNPIFEKYDDGDNRATFIHGVEYQIHGGQNKIFPTTDINDDNAPCAVCQAKSRGSHMMIPARNVCPSGWTMEYKGYLMAERYNHKGRTQFICVDGNPEGTHGSHADTNGALLYFVEGYCGAALPCPPYVHGRELTCVVCTQ